MLTRRTISTLWCREKWLFALVGGSVALVGHGLLKLLIALGCAATIANVLQAVATLQLNFVANGPLTWRRQIGGRGSRAAGPVPGAGGAGSPSPAVRACCSASPCSRPWRRRPAPPSPTGACWSSAAWGTSAPTSTGRSPPDPPSVVP